MNDIRLEYVCWYIRYNSSRDSTDGKQNHVHVCSPKVKRNRVNSESDVFPGIIQLFSLPFPLSDPDAPFPRSSSLAIVLLSVPNLECV